VNRRSGAGRGIDPISLEVVCEGLISVVREMRQTVFRAAYSSILYEGQDFSCALFDPRAQMVAQSEDLPGHVTPMPWSVRCAMEDLGADLRPGDVVLLNDPYRGGTHLNDVTMLYPVFEGGRLFLFPCVRAHWADVGGAHPGSMAGSASDIMQEGVRIPPIKIVERGRVNQAAMDLMLANMRVPEERRGDFAASLAACQTAERRIREMVRKYGAETLLACVAANLDRTERRIRERIAALPDGSYHYEDYLEYYHEGRLDPVLMRLALTIAGPELTADFRGSSPQVPWAVNSTLAVTLSGVFVAVKSLLDPHGPVNHGVLRPLRILADEASIVNVAPPAPAGAHGDIRKRAISCTLGALAQAAPELAFGDLCGTSFHNMMGGVHPGTGRSYVWYEYPTGGNGAFREADGPDVLNPVDWSGDMTTIQPIESIEQEFPLRVERTEFRQDSGGPGERRGGLGVRRDMRLLAAAARYSVLSDRAVIPPYGVLGAAAGAPVRSTIVRDGSAIEIPTPGKVAGFPMRAGDLLVMESAGGGGWGLPLARDAELVAADVRAGYVSAGAAADQYGVVLGPDGRVDAGATAARREALRASRVRLRVVRADRELFGGIVGRHRRCLVAPATAARLGLEAMALVELVGRHPTPLRAWVHLDREQSEGAIPIDTIGLAILGVAPGALVEVRRMPAAGAAAPTAGGGPARREEG
jgi:N-methylhydantoinase B